MRPVRSTRRVFASFLCVLASALFIPAAELSARAAPAGSPAPLSGSLLVVENAGQFDPAVRFQVRAGATTLWVTETSLWLTRVQPSPDRRPHPEATARDVGSAEGLRGVNLELTFPGHQAHLSLVSTDPTPTRMNYFRGSDPSRWPSGVRTWGAVTWRGLYPGISLT